MIKSNNNKNWLTFFPTIALGYLAGRFYPTVVLLLIIFGGAGFYFAYWYTKKEKRNERRLELLFWSNSYTWLIPILGFFTSVATLRMNYGVPLKNKNDQKKYLLLGTIGLIFSCANLIIGTYKYVIR